VAGANAIGTLIIDSVLITVVAHCAIIHRVVLTTHAK
jgi:hypothetical protein